LLDKASTAYSLEIDTNVDNTQTGGLNSMSSQLFSMSLLLTAIAAVTATSTPYGGTPHAIPGTIETEHYDEGDPGVAYHDVDPENLGAPYRKNTQVDIEKRSDASNGHGIGWTRAGEWLVYSVDVKESGKYTIEFPVASQKKGGTFHLEFDGKDVTGPIQVPDTKAWTKLETIRVEGIELKAGTALLKLVLATEGDSGSIGDIDYMRFIKTQ